MSTQAVKPCKECGEEKALSEFYAALRGRGGLMACCKTCHRVRCKRYAERLRIKHGRLSLAEFRAQQADRRRQMLDRYIEGVTLDKIAWEFGVTKQGVCENVKSELQRSGMRLVRAFRLEPITTPGDTDGLDAADE